MSFNFTGIYKQQSVQKSGSLVFLGSWVRGPPMPGVPGPVCLEGRDGSGYIHFHITLMNIKTYYVSQWEHIDRSLLDMFWLWHPKSGECFETEWSGKGREGDRKYERLELPGYLDQVTKAISSILILNDGLSRSLYWEYLPFLNEVQIRIIMWMNSYKSN